MQIYLFLIHMQVKVNPLKGIFNDYTDLNKKVFFFLVCLITFLLLFIKKSFIESELTAFEILEERGQLGVWHILNAFQYLSIPIIYLYKFTVISFILWIGCFMFGYKVHYSKLWQLVMLGEFIFFGAEVVKIGWFLFGKADPDIWEIRAFYPFSLINLVDYRQVGDAWHYPLKAINLFEIFYWFFLTMGIQYLSRKRYDISLYIVFGFYVFWFFAWLAFFIVVYE